MGNAVTGESGAKKASMLARLGSATNSMIYPA